MYEVELEITSALTKRTREIHRDIKASIDWQKNQVAIASDIVIEVEKQRQEKKWKWSTVETHLGNIIGVMKRQMRGEVIRQPIFRDYQRVVKRNMWAEMPDFPMTISKDVVWRAILQLFALLLAFTLFIRARCATSLSDCGMRNSLLSIAFATFSKNSADMGGDSSTLALLTAYSSSPVYDPPKQSRRQNEFSIALGLSVSHTLGGTHENEFQRAS